MPAIEKSILVHAPAQTAYTLWPDFERFPEFMEEVDWGRRIDETHLLWRVNFTGEPCEWETEVPVRIPQTRTSWRSHSGFRSSSAVSFVDGEPGQRMITLGIIFDPGGVGMVPEEAGNFPGTRLERDLQRFKTLVEARAGRRDRQDRDAP